MLDRLATLMVLALGSLIVLVTAAVLSLAATHIALSAGQQPSKLLETISTLVLLGLGNDSKSLTPLQYLSVISETLNVSLVVLAIVVSGFPLISFVNNRLEERKRRIIKVYNVRAQPDDFKVMAKYYSGAESVVVFSGDFSWVKENAPAREVIRELAKGSRISLESYKAEPVVREALGRDLFDELRPVLRFETGKRIKCSLIKYQGSSVFLYRSRATAFNEGRDTICAVTDSPSSRYLLEALDVLCWQATSPLCAAIIVGLPGSGKSTAAAYLRHVGFRVVSAGDVIRDQCRSEGGDSTSCRSLSECGARLLRDRGFDYLGNLLLQRAGRWERIAFDGIRPPEVVQWIRKQAGMAVVIWIEASEPARRERLLNAKGEDEETYRQMMDSPVERMAINARPLADVTICNDASLADFYSALDEAVFPLLMKAQAR